MKGARSLAAGLDEYVALTSLDLYEISVRAVGAPSLVVALGTNRALECLNPSQNLVADLLRVDKLALKVASWVAYSVVRRRNELLGDALAAVLAFGDELPDLKLPDRSNLWRTPGGRGDFAAVYLLPSAEATLRTELQRLADAFSKTPGSQCSHPDPVGLCAI